MNYESGIFSKKYLPSANPIPAPSPFQGERCLFQQAGRRSKKGKQSQIVIQNLAYFANGERDFIFEIKVLCFTKNMDSSSQKLGKADLILEELNLLAFLEQLGEAGVVGSVALNLIVKPDLDFHLLIEDEDLLPTACTIMAYLLEQSKIHEIRLTDWREEHGLKIGVDAYPTDSEEWSIDIWVTNDRITTAFDFVQTLNKTLNQNQRLTILKIKTHFYNQGLLRDGLSLKIYKAVVEQGVKTVDEFLDLSNE